MKKQFIISALVIYGIALLSITLDILLHDIIQRDTTISVVVNNFLLGALLFALYAIGMAGVIVFFMQRIKQGSFQIRERSFFTKYGFLGAVMNFFIYLVVISVIYSGIVSLSRGLSFSMNLLLDSLFLPSALLSSTLTYMSVVLKRCKE